MREEGDDKGWWEYEERRKMVEEGGERGRRRQWKGRIARLWEWKKDKRHC